MVGARDLDQESLRRSFKDFPEKASSSGPNTIAFIYLSGYGLQLEGENYFAPIDARIERDLDVPTQAVRLSDYTRPLNTLNLKATILVLDAARQSPFAKSGTPLASGLALVDPQPNAMVAFSAAPGTIAPEAKQGSYGAYAQALTEMMREGGFKLDELFEESGSGSTPRQKAPRCRGTLPISRPPSCSSSARPKPPRRPQPPRKSRPRSPRNRSPISGQSKPITPQ